MTDWEAATGTTWTLGEIDGHAPVAGSEVTLAIDAAGKVSGNAGANRYFGSCAHTPTGGLTMSPLGSTRMYAAEPPGLMDQEARFLALLGSATGMRVEGSALVILVAGEEKLRFVRE